MQYPLLLITLLIAFSHSCRKKSDNPPSDLKSAEGTIGNFRSIVKQVLEEKKKPPEKNSPFLSISANDATLVLAVRRGEDVKIKWNSEGYDACAIDGLDLRLDPKNRKGELVFKSLSNPLDLMMTCKRSTALKEIVSSSRFLKVVLLTENQGPKIAFRSSSASSTTKNSDSIHKAQSGDNIQLEWEIDNAVNCLMSPQNLIPLPPLKQSEWTLSNLIQERSFVIDCFNQRGRTAVQKHLILETKPLPLVSLKVQNQEGALYVEKDKVVKIDWTSQHADTCTLNLGTETESGLSGQKDFTISKFESIRLTCKNSTGESVRWIPVQLNPSKPLPAAKLLINDNGPSVKAAIQSPLKVTWEAPEATDCSLFSANTEGSGSKGQISTTLDRHSLTIELICTYQDGVLSYSVAHVEVDKTQPPKTQLMINGLANALTVEEGTPALISWTSEHATSCTLNPLNENQLNGLLYVEALKEANFLTLDCRGPGGRSVEHFTINITPAHNKKLADCTSYSCFNEAVRNTCAGKTFTRKALDLNLDEKSGDCALHRGHDLLFEIALPLAENEILCGLTTISSEDSLLLYAGESLVSMNDIIIASSTSTWMPFAERKRWLLLDETLTFPFDPDSSPYCFSSNSMDCLIPVPLQQGLFALSIPDAATQSIQAYSKWQKDEGIKIRFTSKSDGTCELRKNPEGSIPIKVEYDVVDL